MNKEELYDLIERYLDGTLPDAEHQAVERQMTTDADFRTEVELHRALHTSLGDAGNFRLRTALDNLLRDPPPIDDFPSSESSPPASSPRWPRLTGIVVLLAVAVFFVWRWVTPGETSPRSNSPQPEQNQPLIDTTTPSDPVSPPIKSNPNKPIAMADPADFAPNPVLEARIGDMMRGSGIGFELSSPAVGASFQLHDGRITLPVRGVATGGDIPTDQPLELLIYPNRPEAWDNKQPLATFSLPLTPYAPNSYLTEFRPVLRARPGLYYLVVGQRRPSGDDEGHIVLWIGKFIVQAGN